MSRRACAKKPASSGSAGRQTTPRRAAAPRELFLRWPAFESRAAAAPRLQLEQLALEIAGAEHYALASQPTPRFRGNVRAFAEAARQRLRAGERLLVAGASNGETERLAEILGEYEIPYRFGTPAGQRPGLVEEKSVLAPPLAGQAPPVDGGAAGGGVVLLVPRPGAGGVSVAEGGVSLFRDL